ncbi:MAG: hypothetical protein ABMB14_29190 [Myxococcota bacterium]
MVPRGSLSARILAPGLSLGLALSAVAWLLLATSAPTTGARRVTWLGPDGRAIARDPPGALSPWDGCNAQDIRLTALEFDDSLFTVCRDEGLFPQGALGRIRAASLAGGHGIGEVLWPVPETLPIEYTAGLAPGTDGRLGIAYVTGGIEGRLAVAVAGRQGWRCAPRTLPGGPGSRLYGLSWVDDTLEAVFFPAAPDDARGLEADAHILRLAPDCHEEIRTVARDSLVAGPGFCANVDLAFRRPEVDGWLFASVCGEPGVEAALWEVTETGDRRPSPWAPEYSTGRAAFGARDEIVQTSAGLLDHSLYYTATLGPDGGLTARPEPVAQGWAVTTAWNHFATRDSSLSWLPLWYRDGEAFGVAHRIEGRTVAVWSGEGVEGYPLTLSFVGEDAPPITVARAASFSCGNLVVGMLLPRAPEGHWLVEPSGCYIGVDAYWHRADPLDLAEHLRRRGSIGMDWDEPQHGWWFGWALLGLPVSTGTGAVVGAIGGRVRALHGWMAKGVVVGAWVYVVTTAWVLVRLLPLLR